MICTSLQYRDLDDILDALEAPGMEMAEIRLDNCELTPDDIDYLFSDSDVPLIATCRISETVTAATAEARLIKAIRAGAAYVDLELDAPPMMSKRIRREAAEYGTRLIRSFHDFHGTDSAIALQAIIDKCVAIGAEVVKIATTARDETDCRRVLELYEERKDLDLVAFCMGEIGKDTRMDCLRKGAPFTYACLHEEEATAPGQWPLAVLSDRIYGDLKMVGYHSADGRERLLELPAAKSLAQRAILAAALAEGTSWLHGYSPCGDSEAALSVAQALGAEVTRDGKRKKEGETLVIKGIAARKNSVRLDRLHVGEAGFLARMMIPLAAELNSGEEVEITGEKTLLQRPLKGAEALMQAFGVELSGDRVPLRVRGKLSPSGKCGLAADGATGQMTGNDDSPTDRKYCPSGKCGPAADGATGRMTGNDDSATGRKICPSGKCGPAADGATGRMTGNDDSPTDRKYSHSGKCGPAADGKGPDGGSASERGVVEISGKDGSQLISGLLSALPLESRDTDIVLKTPKSIPYIFMTIDVLKKFGILIDNEMEGGADFVESRNWDLCEAMRLHIKGGQKYLAADFGIEKDWSSAACFLVAGAIFGRVALKGPDTSSLQADLSIIDILMEAGASISQEEDILRVQRAPLYAFDIDAGNCPDLFPIVALLAAFCKGVSQLGGVSRLRNKESDRAAAIVEMLTQLGVKARIAKDKLLVTGLPLCRRLLEGKLLKGGKYTSHRDHRIAMTLKIAQFGADGPIEIDDTECLGKSFPAFLETYARL